MADDRARQTISGSFKPSGKNVEVSGTKGTRNFTVGHNAGTNIYTIMFPDDYDDYDSAFVQLQSSTLGHDAKLISEPNVTKPGSLVIGVYASGVGNGTPLNDLAADTNTRIHFSVNVVPKKFDADDWNAKNREAAEQKSKKDEEKKSSEGDSQAGEPESQQDQSQDQQSDAASSESPQEYAAMKESEGEKSDSTKMDEIAPPNKDHMQTKTSDEPEGKGLTVDKGDKSAEAASGQTFQGEGQSSSDKFSVETGPAESPYAGHVPNDVSTLSGNAKSGAAKKGNKPAGVPAGDSSLKSDGTDSKKGEK